MMHEGTVGDVTSHIAMSNDAAVTYTHYDMDGEIASDNTIKTGDTVRMTVDENWYYDYLIVVYGDVNSDGAVNSGDYVKIKKHILEWESLTDASPGFLAADLNDDDNVSSIDYIKVRKYIMNGGNA